MAELAGWGTPDWLPPNVARRAARDDARDAREAAAAERERELRTEERHSRALALYQEQAAVRGEEISAVALATGKIRGRSVQDILAAAVAESAREDAREALRVRREGEGTPVHIEVGEPQLLSSPIKRTIASRSRRWQEWQEKKKAAEDARRAVEASRDLGLPGGVTLRPGGDDGRSRRGGRSAAHDGGLRFR